MEFDHDKGAPCQRACPAGIDIPHCHRLISLGKLNEALDVYREQVPFPAVLGYVCPAPCEIKCRMAEINNSVSVKALKRFVAEKVKTILQLTPAAPTNKRIAIVGSGPAGLTTAYYLTLMGHRVTVFEALPTPGGMMRYGIPEYRLPRSVLDREIEAIKNTGVEIRLNSRIESLDKLYSSGFDAVFLAIGAHKALPLRLNIPDSLLDSIVFLNDVNSGKKVVLGKRVGVIGGGNAAIDCARTALRLGAKNTTIIYRRTRSDMPASREEIEAALEEGIEIIFLATPKSARKNDAIKVVFQRMKAGDMDAGGRHQPEPIEGDTFQMEFDTLISAIGQEPDIPEKLGLKLKSGDTIAVDNDLMTSRKGVFAGGDAVTGPSYVIDAIAAGKKAAVSIDIYLGGKTSIPEAASETTIVPQIPLSLSIDRITSKMLPAAERLATFKTVELGLSDKEAADEARRCLWCDLERVTDAAKCAQCRTCQLVCSLTHTHTFNISKARVVIGSGMGIEGEEPKFTDECVNCNLCARYCSYDAISLKKAGGK